MIDHVFILLLFVVQPIHGAREFAAYLKSVESGQPADRVKLYRQTTVLEWIAFAVLLAAWFYLGRPVSDLGFVAPGGAGFWLSAAFIVAVSAYLIFSWQKSRSFSSEEKQKHIEALGDLRHFLPTSKRDYRYFFTLSITAGVVEETLYRGFALWYLAQFMPLWTAVVVSSIAFGLAHSYQGAGGVVRVAIAGLVAGTLFVLSGSIWLPIAGHFLLDALQGLSLVEILRNNGKKGQAL